ncbi:MAG: hypothetical protein SFY81_01220 [Verrucomicrobiota bacterium]|nr:hypothetical protein [Verrucomicrobiota bacterium]
MKYTKAVWLGLLSGLILPLHANDKHPLNWSRVAFVGEAVHKSSQGLVERLGSDNQWHQVKAGDSFLPGSFIRTQSESSAVFQMKDSGSLVRLTPRTMLRLAPLDQTMERSTLTGREERSGFVVRAVRGKAEFKRNGEWKKLNVGDVLAIGTPIRTSSKSTLDLFRADTGMVLRASPATFLILENRPRSLSGRLSIVNPHQVQTPIAVAATR